MNFCLKNPPKDENSKSSNYLTKAKDLYHPEALSFWTRQEFEKLKTTHEMRLEQKLNGSFHSQSDEDTYKEKLNTFLDSLESLAYMDLIFMDQVTFLKDNDLGPIPDIVQDVIKRKENGQYARLMEENLETIIFCSNQDCDEIIDEVIRGFYCNVCLNALYCTRTCKSRN